MLYGAVSRKAPQRGHPPRALQHFPSSHACLVMSSNYTNWCSYASDASEPQRCSPAHRRVHRQVVRGHRQQPVRVREQQHVHHRNDAAHLDAEAAAPGRNDASQNSTVALRALQSPSKRFNPLRDTKYARLGARRSDRHIGLHGGMAASRFAH